MGEALIASFVGKCHNSLPSRSSTATVSFATSSAMASAPRSTRSLKFPTTDRAGEAAKLIAILRGFEEASAVFVAQAQRWHPEIRRRADAEHQALLKAFRDRDVDSAIEVMSEHPALSLDLTRPEERERH